MVHIFKSDKGKSKGQSAGSAATFIAILTVLIILYILFLPPDMREDILSDGSGGGGSDGGSDGDDAIGTSDELFKQHQAERQATTSALKELYGALTPEQKSVADQLFGGFGPGYGAGYGRGPGGRFR